MYRAEPSLVMNAERSEPKLPLCPSCARNMRLIRRTQRFGTLPDICTFECRGCGVSHFEEHEPAKPSGALISMTKKTLLQTHHQQTATVAGGNIDAAAAFLHRPRRLARPEEG